mgnify:CR=1 FL=1
MTETTDIIYAIVDIETTGGKFNQEKIALAQETRVLEHVDLATVALDNGQPLQGVVDNLLPT